MSSNQHLRERPDVPPEVLRAAQDGNLVIFVGAGVSRLVGGPSWQELASGALEMLAQKGMITFSDIKQLSRFDARAQLTIASQIAETGKLSIDWGVLLAGHDRSEEKSKIYEYINSMGCPCVTTNYDDRLQPRLPSSEDDSVAPEHYRKEVPICRPKQFHAGHLRRPGTVVHLHGSKKEPDSMVITTSDYIKHYEDTSVQFFLRELFEKHTALFVGYGLAENEILEHIVRKGHTGPQSERKRFVLQGYYSHEGGIVSYVKRYFEECFGVHVCGFTLDYKDHHQLEIIMKDWTSKIEVQPPALAEDLQFVLEAASE